MTTPRIWHRLCIDVDCTGGPIGVSVESYDDDVRTNLIVDFSPGPFDTVADCLIAAVTIADRFHGCQLELPL